MFLRFPELGSTHVGILLNFGHGVVGQPTGVADEWRAGN